MKNLISIFEMAQGDIDRPKGIQKWAHAPME